jgi:HK97 gp10 family phage protein
VFRDAAEAGAKVVQSRANSDAPGPHIGIDVDIDGQRAVAKIGPLKAKWYYRFREFGTQAHGAKRKSTRFQRWAKRQRISVTDTAKPAMRWFENGQPIFRRKVSGIPARPFLQPAMQHPGAIIEAVGAVYLKAIEEAAR